MRVELDMSDAINRTGVQMRDEPLTEETDYQKMATRASQGLKQDDVDLGIRGVQFKQYYQVRVKGKSMSQPFEQRVIAEQFVMRLTHEDQPLAEIVTVTAAGQELLLG
jgi:hypothetical protein